MRQLLGKCERLGAPCECLVRITEIPEDDGRTAQTNCPFVLAKDLNMEAVSLRIIVGNPSFEMVASGAELAHPETGNTQSIVGLYEEHGVLYALGHIEKLLPEFLGCL
jgi:hypothetical protein